MFSAQSDDEGSVHLSVGVSEQNIRKAVLQHVLAQEWRILHNLSESGLNVRKDKSVVRCFSFPHHLIP